jgi:hypothetical protein
LAPRGLGGDIEQAIADSASEWEAFVDVNRQSPGEPPLAVKYVPCKYAPDYVKLPNKGLHIGENNFTWGQGVYVTGIEEPLSTAIYGRVGVVSWFDPVDWRAFDARDPANVQLYLQWLQAQPNYEDAVLKVHSDHWLHSFRNDFREQFSIDVVLFHPDERDRLGWYTDPAHIWLAVSDWVDWVARDQLAKGYSARFKDARLTIVAEEEFATDKPALTRSPQLKLSSKPPLAPPTLRQAYSRGEIRRVES